MALTDFSVNGLRVGTLVELKLDGDERNGALGQVVSYSDAEGFGVMLINGTQVTMKPDNVRIPPELKRPGMGGSANSFDVLVGPRLDESLLADEISACLFEKGFCVMRVCQSTDEVGETVQAMKEMAEAGKLNRFAEEVEEGYLGTNNRGKVAWIDSADKDSPKDALLDKNDAFISQLAALIQPYCADMLGKQIDERTPALMSLALTDEEEPEYPPQDADDASLGQFLSIWRRKLVQVLAHLVNRSRASGGGAAALQGLVSELMVFCHAPFTQACRPPPGRGKDPEFLAHTDGLINEAALLLKAAFDMSAPAEAAVLFEHGPALLSEVLGLFEYNNIDVEVNSPLAPFFARKVQALAASCATHPEAAAELQAVERLLREKEWMMRCAWGEETTGIYEDDVEAPATNDAATVASEMDSDAAMGEGDAAAGDLYDPKVSSALMAEVGAQVAQMSLEQLIQAPWPTMHGTALYVSVARINHSCMPNLKIEFHRNCTVRRVT